MTDTEIKSICNANICTHRFNYMNAAKEIVKRDRDEEETKAIFPRSRDTTKGTTNSGFRIKSTVELGITTDD